MIETLPVELIGKILGELDLTELIRTSQLSRRLRLVASDTTINVWRPPILRNLLSDQYEDAFKNLSVYTTVPRYNWVDILSMGKASFLLFEATLPNLKDAEWEEAFRRRFLPSFKKWKTASERWKAVFLRVLHQTWHRSRTFCTTNEASTKYIVLNRNGSANILQVSSRNFNPVVILNDMRAQHNMLQLEMRTRLVVQFPDVRILALGTLHRPRSPFTVNTNAKAFLHPPGIESESSLTVYSRLRHPLPAQMHSEYPFITPGGADKRWIISQGLEEAGLQWVGGLMIVAQIREQDSSSDWASQQDEELIVGPGRHQYASLYWEDLWTIAPWLQDLITKQIDGPGLGN